MIHTYYKYIQIIVILKLIYILICVLSSEDGATKDIFLTLYSFVTHNSILFLICIKNKFYIYSYWYCIDNLGRGINFTNNFTSFLFRCVAKIIRFGFSSILSLY